jgi:hypothetical protein
MFAERKSQAGIYRLKWILEKLSLEEGPYMALFLKEVNHTIIDKQKLRLPLLAACSMSKHIRLILPMSQPTSILVDGVFNELFKCQSRADRQALKDFVVGSKGILYAKDITLEEEKYILRYATFLMTTDVRIWRTALSIRLPNAFISQCENKEPEILVSTHGDIEDARLIHTIAIELGNMHYACHRR